jgi:multidrug efflux pump subunit AcrA (membrane-fusion protein)
LQALKTQKEADRSKVEEEHKARKSAKPEAEQTSKTQKEGVTLKVGEGREAEQKAKLEDEKAVKARKEAEHTSADDERKALKRAEQEAAEAKTRAQKAALAERNARQSLEKKGRNTKESKPEKSAPTAPPQPIKPVSKHESASAMQPITPAVKSAISTSPVLAPREIMEKRPEPQKTVESGKSASRRDMIKIVIVNKDTDSECMVDFENSLRKIPDIRLVMIGGTTSDGAQIIVSSEKSVVLSNILRQLPMVEEVTNRQADVLVKLKPVFIFASNI